MARHGISIIGSLLFVLLLLSPMILADQEQLLELAKDVPDDKLHAALHDYSDGKFKHGIFPGDRTALEAVHRERAADATAIVLLAKRQSNNTTLTTSTRSTPPPTSLSSTTTTREVTSTPTPPSTGTTSTTTSGTSTASTPTSSESTSSTTSPTPTPTPTPTSTSTSTTSSTTIRSTTSYTSRITRTVTGENGQPSTTTEVTVVVAAATEPLPSTEPTPSSSTTAASVMQNSNGVNGLKVRVGEAAGAAGVAALIFFML